jgi:hypothetical protein
MWLALSTAAHVAYTDGGMIPLQCDFSSPTSCQNFCFAVPKTCQELQLVIHSSYAWLLPLNDGPGQFT